MNAASLHTSNRRQLLRGFFATICALLSSSSTQTTAQIKSGRSDAVVYPSLIAIRLKPGQRDQAIDTFEKRVFPECAGEVEGFISAEVQICLDDDNLIFVSSRWLASSDYDIWQQSPLRDAQLRDLGGMVAAAPIGGRVDLAHRFQR
jgi:heme-degrading monooxygenase HmoA